jgi:transcription elongation factor Elf1
MSRKNSKKPTMKLTSNFCPVCGYDKLTGPPRNRTGGASMEICACCGFQFGVTDDDKGISIDDYRQQWIADGMPWSSAGKKAPKGWNPQTQLGSLALRATLSRVKGRPPRMAAILA